MGFDFPWGFLLLIAILPTLLLLRRSELRTRDAMNAFRSASPATWYFNLRYLLLSVFIGSLAIVATGPYLEPSITGDYLFLVDTSRSMQARNSCGEPTFFMRTKAVMQSILEGMPEGKFGIVAFDRYAFPITQLTYDTDYLNEVINNSLSIGMFYQATDTNISNALSVTALKKKSLPAIFGKVEYVILLTDGHLGSDNWQDKFEQVLQELRETNIKIIAVGIGNPVETPIPIISATGECLDKFIRVDGEVVRIPLRGDILKLIASETQGKYFGEVQVAELVEFMREETFTSDMPENLISVREQRNSISWIFLLSATVALFSFLTLRKG
jgi:uncharacterized protein YegL